MESWCQHGHQEAVVDVAEQLLPDIGMGDLRTDNMSDRRRPSSACGRTHPRVPQPPHLNDGVAELQRVEELDQGRHLEPVLPVEAVPVLAGDIQLGGQGGVQAAEACGQNLSTEYGAAPLDNQQNKQPINICSHRTRKPPTPSPRTC